MAIKSGVILKWNAAQFTSCILQIKEMTLCPELRPDRNHSYRRVTSAAAGVGKCVTVALLLALDTLSCKRAPDSGKSR